MNNNVEHSSPDDEEYIRKICEEQFLPVREKVREFLLPWKSDKVGPYTSCSDACIPDATSLVCCWFLIVEEEGAFLLHKDKLKQKLGVMVKPISEQNCFTAAQSHNQSVF